MARLARTVLAVLVAFGFVLGLGSAAHANVAGIDVTPYNKCLSGGVTVHNTTGGGITVRVKLDGTPIFSGVDTTDVANNATKDIYADPPAGGTGTYTVFLINPDLSETLVGTTSYSAPDYCSQFPVSFVDNCTSVIATVTNNSPADYLVTFIKVTGATYPLGNVNVPKGQTKSITLAINNDVHDIWTYIANPIGDYVDAYIVKGGGNSDECVPDKTTTPEPTATAPPLAGGGLPDTGIGPLVPMSTVGTLLVVTGVIFLLIARRTRSHES